MTIPNTFNIGAQAGTNIVKGIRGGFENNRIDQILQEAQASQDPQQIKNVMSQILTHVSPEKQPAVMNSLQQRLNEMGDTSTEAGYNNMLRQRDLAGQFENYASPLLEKHNITPEERNRFFQASKQFENIPNLQERFAKTAKLLASQQQSETSLYETGKRPGFIRSLRGEEEQKIKDLQPLVKRMQEQGFTNEDLYDKLIQLGHGQVEIEKTLSPMNPQEETNIYNIGQQSVKEKKGAGFVASEINRMITPQTSMVLIYENLLKSGMNRDEINKTFEYLNSLNPNLTDRQLRQISEMRTRAREFGPQQIKQKLDKIFGLKR
jgi:uncharacterized protein Smg (DUF494 family)